LFQFNDTAEVIIDTLSIENNQYNLNDKRRNLQSSDSFMNPMNR